MNVILMTFLWLALFLLPFIILMVTNLTSTIHKKHPPGPTPLPIIGNLHLLGVQPHISLAKLAKTHGPIMTLKLGQITTVVISSSLAAKEVLQKQDTDFSTRSVPDAVTAENHSQNSVVFLPVANKWRTLRKVLNSYIFSANRLDANQQLRYRKVQDIIAYCKKRCEAGEPVDIGQAAFTTTLNLLSNLFFSKDLSDPFSVSAKEFKNVIWDIMVEAGRPNIVDFFPILEKFDPLRIRRRMSIHFSKVFEMFRGIITARLESRENGGEIRLDVLDDLLALRIECPEEIDRNLIEHVFLDLFVAGTDTSSSTLEWAMTELLRDPRSLERVQAELAEAVGRGKHIEEIDLPRLPYLQCVMKETLRLHPAVPFLVPRKVVRDVELLGYIVPGGSQILVNAWAIGRNEAVREDALVFKPERFLESEIDVRGHDFELIPFGAGRRICPGLSLALKMIPIVLGSLLNVFDWKLEDGIAPEKLNMEEKFGFTLQKARPLLAVPLAL